MSKSKKPSASGAKYKVGGRVYIIIYHKEVPEELLEGSIMGVTTNEYSIGKGGAVEFNYSYTIKTSQGAFLKDESETLPNYTEASKVFAKAFLKPLK